MANLKDFAITTVQIAPSPATSGTSLTVATDEGDRLPETPFYATVMPSDAPFASLDNAEKILVTSRTDDTLTIERAQGTTEAQSIESGWIVFNALYAADLIVSPDEVEDNSIVRFDGETGKTVQESPASINDAGDLQVEGAIVNDGNFNGVYLFNSTIGELKYADFSTDNLSESIGFFFRVQDVLKAAFSLYTGNNDFFLDAYDDSDTKILMFAANAEGRKFVITPYRSDGMLGINTYYPTHALDVNADTIRLQQKRTVSSSTAAGLQGEICYDDNYLYICVATDTWKRIALSTW